MRIIIAGVPKEMRDDYARRMIEQGYALPAPPVKPAPVADAQKAEAPKGKRGK